MDFFTINLLTSEEEYSHYFSTLLMSSKISIWSIKSASVIRSSWWPCLDRENFKVVLQFPPSTAVRCLSYNRRKIKSKTCISVKKWFFSKKRSFPRLLTFWWNCFNWLPQCKAKNYRLREFPVFFLLYAQWRRVVKCRRYFNVWINGEIPFISI